MKRRASAGPTALCVVACIPWAAWGEGNVRLLECEVVRACDAAGECRPESGHVTFEMEPRGTEADGSGSYTLRYEGFDAVMEATSAIGPFVWALGSERNALLASSETEFLWHRLELVPVPEATIRFLTCTFSQ